MIPVCSILTSRGGGGTDVGVGWGRVVRILMIGTNAPKDIFGLTIG